MNKKIVLKIILIIGIILIIYFIAIKIFFKCGPRIQGFKYNIKFCDKTCEKDEECVFACGCGAINTEETCFTENKPIECEFIPNEQIKCIKGKCKVEIGK